MRYYFYSGPLCSLPSGLYENVVPCPEDIMTKPSLLRLLICLAMIVAPSKVSKSQVCVEDPAWCWKKGQEFCSVCGVGGSSCGTVACTVDVWGYWTCPASSEQYRLVPATNWLFNCSTVGTGSSRKGCKDGSMLLWCVGRRDCAVGACIKPPGQVLGRQCTSTAGAFTGNVCGIQEKLPCGTLCTGS